MKYCVKFTKALLTACAFITASEASIFFARIERMARTSGLSDVIFRKPDVHILENSKQMTYKQRDKECDRKYIVYQNKMVQEQRHQKKFTEKRVGYFLAIQRGIGFCELLSQQNEKRSHLIVGR